ncbi:PREDICTED: endogenous retrovirus group K member 19 Pol protein [Calidris pugnax]|uniref:endogenous retrovirus group K member 19 Pol protein n=1 Tax=Calidris pugnax TaxID=198806 RepID=UPI00071E437B|nr:PREDICTED: endogenous retrovirus group K member 19 Pol protein [Calidris pugnax]
MALAGYVGQLTSHPPPHKLFNSNFSLIPKPKRSDLPLQALTVFTDGSGNSHKSVILWWDDQRGQWNSDIETVPDSPQIVELTAVVRVFRKWSMPLNIITDSAYVAGIVERAEASVLRDVSHSDLFALLQELIFLLDSRPHPYFIMHVRAHTSLPGFIAEGNRQADLLTLQVQVLPDRIAQAKLSHSFFHQNAGGLKRQFGLTSQQAANIIAVCPDCQKHSFPSIAGGVNPRGLQSLQLWQTDVTHYSEFGKLKYVHSSIDTFSGALFASCHTGEKSRDVHKHLMRAFATLGVPSQIKTDNGPAYTSATTKTFLDSWGVTHITGIPHSPTGQSLIERSHQSLKRLLQQQKGGVGTATPEECLQKALYVFNFLNCSLLDNNPPIVRHFNMNDSLEARIKAPVLV